MIKRTIISREKETILELYKALVRVTKMIKGFGNLEYEERLNRCKLTTLEKRRERGDLIETFKIVTGRDRIPAQQLFEFSANKRTRGHSYKIVKKSSGAIMQRFFSVRVVNSWNGLDEETVTAQSVMEFKKRLNKVGC